MEIQALLKQMTLEEKIGQICVPILQKGEITPEIAACIPGVWGRYDPVLPQCGI